MNKRIIDSMSAEQIADGLYATQEKGKKRHYWPDLFRYLESICKPEPSDEEYISRLERAVQVLANSNSDWEMNVSVWDTESILSVLDDMSPAKLRKRMMNRPMQPAAESGIGSMGQIRRRMGGDKK